MSVLDNYMDKSDKEIFKVFHLVYGKTYTLDSEEAKERYKNFKNTLEKVKKVNAADLGYKAALYHFADLSEEEFSSKYLNRKIRNKEEWDRDFPEAEFLNNDDDDDLTKRNLATLTSVDWTKLYGTVRDQGDCASCWTFAATGIVEGCLAKKQGSPFQYTSTQQMIDCNTSGQSGCNGGDTISALVYIKSKGLMAESAYKYTANQGSCKYSATKVVAKITGTSYCSNYYKAGSCTATIVNSLLQKGPQAVGIDGGTSGFSNYKSGVFTGTCSNDNHAVVLVGYGVDASKGEFWIIRNSWGSSWGASGYIRVKRNDANKNSCYITNEAVACTC
jgi:C1A family cysteine protease